MKNKMNVFVVCLAVLLLFPACSDKQEPSPTPDQNSTIGQATQDNTEDTPPEENTQRWSANEFRQNEEDWMFFAPETDDYMLTEMYEQEQPDTGIIYTLTILRSFDTSGNVISQVSKYTFDVTVHANLCYQTFSQDGTDYPLLVGVGYSVYVGQPEDVVAGQRTKEQFAADYEADGTKHWLSMP